MTFFHEFGHLVHAPAGRPAPWIGISGISTEQDFVEAPSQMLEEWTWDPATLATFAKHYQTSEPIPAALVTQMRARERIRQGADVRQQMIYAQLSLSIYDRDPKTVDTTAMVEGSDQKYHAVSVMSRARTSRRRSAISTATRRSTTPTCGRWSSRRICSPVRPREPARAGDRQAVPRSWCSRPADRNRPRRWSRLSRPAVRVQGVGNVAQSGVN